MDAHADTKITPLASRTRTGDPSELSAGRVFCPRAAQRKKQMLRGKAPGFGLAWV